jgi:hypothetical protein
MGALKIRVGNGWIVVGGGGGGVSVELDDDPAPSVPSQWDDEFDGDTFDTDRWIPIVPMGNIVATQVNGYLELSNPLAVTFARAFVQVAPVGEFTIVMKNYMPSLSYPYIGSGIFVDNPADTQGRGMQNTFQGDSRPYMYVFRYNKSDMSWGGDVVGQIGFGANGGTVYYRMKRYLKDGVLRINTSVSWDGKQWSLQYDGLETDFYPVGITRIGFNQSIYEAGRGGFRTEYFRVTTP